MQTHSKFTGTLLYNVPFLLPQSASGSECTELLTFQQHMQLSPSSQWPSNTASVCSNSHQGRCMGRCAGPCIEFGSLWCLLWEFPLQMDGQESAIFLVSRQDFPKLRDTYQNKFSNQYWTDHVSLCTAALPHSTPKKKEFKHFIFNPKNSLQVHEEGLERSVSYNFCLVVTNTKKSKSSNNLSVTLSDLGSNRLSEWNF